MSLTTESQVTWRLAERRDVPSLLEIERSSFSTPWTWGELEEELDKPSARVWVAAEEDQVVGFGIQWFIAGESQLANIAFRSDRRGQGLGRKMMERLLEEAQREGMEKMTLEVRVDNRPALELYQRLGFIETSRRARFYEDQADAVLMEKKLEPGSRN
ncbi:MAG: ribosomal protein S18-alanine N-acetyltransferase [Elusimicrobia bacterium]|nr:ribosomal protein S18-alanine N-acetyltransferase [Elusimicrobiota bacterium]